MQNLLVLLMLLQGKHFVVDFLLQTHYQWQNKGKFLHPGGLVHAGLHGIGTFLCVLVFFDSQTALFCAVLDSVFHYVIDYGKVNVTKRNGWRAEHNPEFWITVGFDQYLHQSTYLLLLIYLFV